MQSSDTRSRGGVQSIEVGMHIIKTLAAAGGELSLNEISERSGIHPSKIHRYLVSFIQTGMVLKTAHGRYDLGSYVLELGVNYLARLDPSTVALPVMEELRGQTEEGLILNVWGDAGSTVIRWFQSRHPISVGIRPGATFMTTMSASGRVFLAWLPDEVTRPVVEAEMARLEREDHPLRPRSLDEIEQIKQETREQGLARVVGHSVKGVSALAAPIFDYRGEITLTLALFGFSSSFDTDWEGPNAQLLKAAADKISRQSGWISP